jgi:hypothetical protein
VKEVLLHSEEDWRPEEEVVAEPVVDHLVRVLVRNHQAQLVKLGSI